MPETLRIAVALSLACLALAASASASAGISLPPNWSHAQVNVVIKHVAQTLIYDRGSIASVKRHSLTLREGDGVVVIIPVARSATVTLGGRRVALTALRPGEFATTIQVDGPPATTVRALRVAPAD